MFHRLFASAVWSIDRVGLALFELVAAGAAVDFSAVDDALLPRRGLGGGRGDAAPLSSRGHTAFAWGRCRVVLSVVVELRPTRPRPPGELGSRLRLRRLARGGR